MRSKRLARILALDLHPHRFGYAVLESPDCLLDWGVCSDRRKRHSGDVLIRKRLRRVLESWSPSVILLQCPEGRARQDKFLRRIEAEAKRHRIPVCMLKTKRIEIQGKRLTHYENARQVAERFYVLRWKLPPKRRAWESERYSTSIFTAAALAMSTSQEP